MHHLKAKIHDLSKKARTRISGPSRRDPTNLPETLEAGNLSNFGPRNDRSKPARGADLWAKAYEQLSVEQKTSLFALAGEGNTNPSQQINASTAPITEQMIIALSLRQNECERRFWRFPLGKGPEAEVVLREQTANIIAWINKLGDVAVEFAPSLVKQVWPCVKGVLQIPVKEAEQMAAVLEVANQVSRIASRGRVYETSFTVENTSAEALKALRETLVELYKACLELLATAADLLDDNLVQRTVHSILHPGDVANAAAQEIVDLEKRLASDVQAASAAAGGIMHDQLEALEAPVSRIDANVQRLLRAIAVKDEIKILEWTSMVQYQSHHDKLSDERMAHTCDWLLRHPKFRDWETSTEKAIMWLQGPIGTGKTFLTSKVIDDYMSFVKKDPNQAFAFFYFKRDDSSRNTALSCLRSLLRQLSTSAGCQGHIQAALRELRDDCRKRGRDLNWDMSKTQFKKSLETFPRTTIIIDALDECTKDYRIDLVEMLSDPMVTRNRLLVFVSGRPIGEMRKALLDLPIMKVGVEDNQDDIERFVREKIANHRGWDHFPDRESTKKQVIRTLLEKSQGMFRWAALQVAELLKIRMQEEVSTRLGKLPPDLTAAYKEIYSTQVKGRGGVQSAVAERALVWVLAACRPLNSAQLLSAVRIDVGRYNEYLHQLEARDGIMTAAITKAMPNDLQYVTTPVNRDLLQEFCANLLTWDSRSDTWTFAHASVAEYIEEHKFSILDAHSFVGFACIWLSIDVSSSVSTQRPCGAATCLLLTGEQDDNSQCALGKVLLQTGREQSLPHPVRNWPLVNYATWNWKTHVRYVKEHTGKNIEQCDLSGSHTDMKTDMLWLILERFLRPSLDGKPTYTYWRKARGPDQDGDAPDSEEDASDSEEDVSDSDAESSESEEEAPDHFLFPVWMNDFYAWARHGYWPGQVELLDAYPHAESLAVALRPKSLPPSCRQQLWNQKIAFFPDQRWSPAMFDDWEIDAVEFLSGSWNLLHIASFFGPVELVTDLLEAGMDINEPTSDGRLPLTLAQQGQCREAIRILFDHGGYAPDSLAKGNNPLYQAVMNKSVDFARYLRIVAAEPWDAIPWADSRTICHQAVRQIQARLPWQKSDTQPGNILIKAASCNNMEIIRKLLEERHADPNFRTDNSTPLIAACYSHDVEVAEYLLSKGAAIDTQVSGGHHTALVAALSHRYILTTREAAESTLLLLLRSGANPNLHLENDQHGSALALTAGWSCPRNWYLDDERHDALDYLLWRLKTLIEHKADVNMVLKNVAFGSALVAAAESTLRETLEILIEAGADPNLQLECGDYGSPLICAAASGDAGNVQYLLSVGADINFTASWGLFPTAFVAAANSGNLILFKYLEGRGVDVDQVENQGAEELLRRRVEELLGPIASSVYRTSHFMKDLPRLFSETEIAE